jgi:hypothetical protein
MAATERGTSSGGHIVRRAALLLALALAACSSQSVKTHPVSGRVEVKDGDVAILTMSTVELKHETDETLRPYGNLDAGGNFSLKTLHQGKVIEGAPEGKYRARVILADPSDEGVPKRKGEPIHRRYYEFATSGLTITVPSGDYSLSLSKK